MFVNAGNNNERCDCPIALGEACLNLIGFGIFRRGRFRSVGIQRLTACGMRGGSESGRWRFDDGENHEQAI